MKKESIKNLFITELKDILAAEVQTAQALPEIINAADAPELRDQLQTNLQQTYMQIERLEEIFGILNIHERTRKCETMGELITEVNDVIRAYQKSSLRDAAIISKLQRIEHYEISVYNTLRSFAKKLYLNEVFFLLQDNLDEEIGAEKKLRKIAEGGFLTAGIHDKALRGK